MFSSNFFISSLNNKDSVLKKEKDLKIELKLLSEQQALINKKNIAIKKFNTFIDKAVKLGLTADKWTDLATNINAPVTYLELEEVLNQSANNNSFYFKPEVIEIKKQQNMNSDVKAQKGKEVIGKDVNLTLKGTFIVKNQ